MLGSIMLSLESSASRMTQLAQQQIYFDRFYTVEEVVREIEKRRGRGHPAAGERDLQTEERLR